jgi:hypothetical protein
MKTRLMLTAIIAFLLLIYTASTLVDKETVYLLSFNTRVGLLLLFDIIVGVSVAKMFIEITRRIND